MLLDIDFKLLQLLFDCVVKSLRLLPSYTVFLINDRLKVNHLQPLLNALDADREIRRNELIHLKLNVLFYLLLKGLLRELNLLAYLVLQFGQILHIYVVEVSLLLLYLVLPPFLELLLKLEGFFQIAQHHLLGIYFGLELSQNG